MELQYIPPKYALTPMGLLVPQPLHQELIIAFLRTKYPGPIYTACLNHYGLSNDYLTAVSAPNLPRPCVQ